MFKYLKFIFSRRKIGFVASKIFKNFLILINRMVKKSLFLKIVFQFFLSFKLVYYEMNKLNNIKSYIQKINYF